MAVTGVFAETSTSASITASSGNVVSIKVSDFVGQIDIETKMLSGDWIKTGDYINGESALKIPHIANGDTYRLNCVTLTSGTPAYELADA